MTAAGLYKRIYYLIMPTPKVHGHVTNENGAIACIIEFDNEFLMNIIVHDFRSCIVTKSTLMILDFVS